MMRLRWLIVAGAFVVGGCGTQPWIKPYEQDRLSDSVMAPSQTPLTRYYRQRTFAEHEGAHGIGGMSLNGAAASDP